METDTNFLKQLNQEIEDFKNKNIQVVENLSFNQYQTVNTIFLYHNSKFSSGDIDNEGDRKYFFNINRNPCKVFTKAIDFDTKNIRLLTVGGGDILKTWFMERDLKFWMRDQQFGKTLNRIFRELPIFGTVVIKVVDGKPEFVDLRNFVVSQSADSLDDASYIIEKHLFTVPQFRKVAKDMGWDKSAVEKTIEEFRNMKKENRIRVFERYGETLKDGEWKYRKIYWADVGEDEYDQYEQLVAEKQGVELSTTEVDSHPYWEFHKDKIPGRWLGVGVVEELFEPQIRQNELANIQAKASYWLGWVGFQTRDPGFNRNLKSGVQNGEVLGVDSEITRINVESQNSPYFNQEYVKWQQNRDELTFSNDPIQGERSPAGTPLGSTQLAIGQTLAYFEGIQEEIAMDIKEMLYEVIIPQFEKERTHEHVIRLVGQDLDKYIAMVENTLVNEEVIRQAVKGRLPNEEEKEIIRLAVNESLKKDREMLVTVPKGFYKNVKYDVDIDITGESIDTRVRNATHFAILQAITADPTMLQDPSKRKILYGIAEDGGINPMELFDANTSPQSALSQVSPQGAGGGVSAPALNNALQGSRQGAATV